MRRKRKRRSRSPGRPAEPLDDGALRRLLDRLPAVPRRRRRREALCPARGLAPRAAHRPDGGGSLPPTRGDGRPRPARGGAARSAPARSGRRRPPGPEPERDVLAADGRGHLPRSRWRGEALPVRLTPTPPGRWRWVGTQTLLFEPDGRFPMATDYRAEVPAGTRSAVGGALARAVAWTFTTPPPTLVEKQPLDRPARRDAAALRRLRPAHRPRGRPGHDTPERRRRRPARASGHGGGDRGGRGRAPARGEGAAGAMAGVPGRGPASRGRRGQGDDRPGHALGGRAPQDGHRPVLELPDLRPAEGHGPPLRLERPSARPSRRGRSTSPTRSTRRRSARTWCASSRRSRDCKAEVYGQSLTIRGASKGRTTYRVSLSPEIADVFGQTLEPPAPLAFEVGPAPESLFAPGGTFAVLDPAGGSALLRLQHEPRVAARARPCRSSGGLARLARLPARRPAEQAGHAAGTSWCVATPYASPGHPTRWSRRGSTSRPALAGGHGHVVLVVEPTRPPKEKWRAQAVRVWVQATSIGLDAFVDDQSLLAWATSLRDGRPLAGVVGAAPSRGSPGLHRARTASPLSPCPPARRASSWRVWATTSRSFRRTTTGGEATRRPGRAGSARTPSASTPATTGTCTGRARRCG